MLKPISKFIRELAGQLRKLKANRAMNKRHEQRVQWNESVKYRRKENDFYKTGVLVNISTRGALLWLKENFGRGSNIEVVLESGSGHLHMQMRVVRTEENQHEGYLGFGCDVESVAG